LEDAVEDMLAAERQRRLTQFVSLRQYYRWSVSLYEAAAPSLQSGVDARNVSPDEARRTSAYLAYWFASLYVLAEGWQELKFSHPAVNPFLTDDRLDVLRRFRNFVFHFQKNYADSKFDDLALNDRANVEWALRFAAALDQVLRAHFDELNVKAIASWLLTGNTDLSISAA
jgi:hypothetical protein